MESNVAQLLRRAAQTSPDKAALTEWGSRRTATWQELDELVDAVAHGLGVAGVRAGQRVVIAMGNRIEFVAGYLGTLRAGAVAVPVNPRSTVGELQRMAADSGARLGIADEHAIDAIRQAARDAPEGHPLPTLVTVGTAPDGVGELAWEELVALSGREIPLREDPESLAVLLYTSGTSGRPRAAMLSHRALSANIEQVARVEPPMFRSDDVTLGVLPLFHVYGLNAVLGQLLRQAHTMVLVEDFAPLAALELIAQERVTVVPVAPTVLAHWRSVPGVREKLASVRLLLCGSAPLPPELGDEFTEQSGVPVHQGYGLTECAPVVTSTLCSETLKSGSVGAALPGVELRLVDQSGRRPEGDDPGEIWVRGDNLFSGYWPEGVDGVDADGWFATGDVGFLDRSGDLFLVDRLKELVIVSGFNVYPSEVEDVINEVPEVTEAAVIGVEDERTGEAVVAFVVPREGADAGAVRQAVREHCEQRLARFKQPRAIELVDELSYGVTGKVQKGRLRATARRTSHGLLE